MGVLLKGKSGTIYIFEGPYKLKSSLENEPGVCAIFDDTGEGQKLVDLVGSNCSIDTKGVSSSMIKKDKARSQVSEYSYELEYAAFYISNGKTPKYIEKDIRDFYSL